MEGQRYKVVEVYEDGTSTHVGSYDILDDAWTVVDEIHHDGGFAYVDDNGRVRIYI